MRDGEEIHASEEYQIENFEDGTSILVINHVYPDDYGTISFEAHNPLGVAVTTAEFAVEGIFIIKKFSNVSGILKNNNINKVSEDFQVNISFLFLKIP